MQNWMRKFVLATAIVATCIATSWCQDKHKLRPQIPTDQIIKRSEEAIQHGFDFLVKSQNSDGSWGSHDPKTAALMNFGFRTGNRGSQDAVRTACTAICAEALLFQEKRNESQQRALDLAIEELLKVRKFAYHPGESFNTWGYGYKLGFLVELNESEFGEQYSKRIRPAAQSCVDGLLRHQQHGGGWGYYSGVMRDYQTMSFNTAFFGLSVVSGERNGVKCPRRHGCRCRQRDSASTQPRRKFRIQFQPRKKRREHFSEPGIWVAYSFVGVGIVRNRDLRQAAAKTGARRFLQR